METTDNGNGPVGGYVLQSSQGRYYLVLDCENTYWAGRILRKLQNMREKDLKAFFRDLEESLNDYED